MITKLIRLAKEGKINPNAGMRDSQSKIINAPIEKVWDTISDIANWPTWNQEIAIREIDSVATGKYFTWDDQDHKFKSRLEKIDKPFVLSWVDTSFWIKGIHVWSFEKTEDYQTIATIEVSLQGLIAPLIVNHLRLNRDLLNWLARLKRHVESL